jgi:hypothetical protein
MVNYNDTIIYKICCKNGNVTEIYIGHTTDFKRRKRQHKSSCNNENIKNYNSYVYRFIRANGGWDNWTIVKLCNYPCENITQACIQERRTIYRLNATLNSIRPYQSLYERKQQREEYLNNNKEHIKEQTKEYRNNNVEKIKEKEKEWRINNVEKIKEKQKEHYQINKEKAKDRQKEYYQLNKEKINEKSKEKVNCPNCNKLCGKYKLPRHMKTKKCQSFNQIE